MSSKITVDSKDVTAELKRLAAVAGGSNLVIALKAGILPIQNAAIARVRYLTGTLRRSIHTEVISSSDSYAEVATGTDIDYALRQEYGFTGTDSLGRDYNDPGQPAFRPALAEKQSEALQEVSNVLKRLIGV